MKKATNNELSSDRMLV